MLTMACVALLEMILIIFALDRVVMPPTATALIYILWILVILRVSWWDVSKGVGYVSHVAYLLTAMWVLHQAPRYILAIKPVYTATELSDPLGGLLVTAFVLVLPFGILVHPIMDGVRVINSRWRPW